MNQYVNPLGDWDELEKKLFTPEELAQSDRKAAIICDLIDRRNAGQITQTEMETALEVLDTALDDGMETSEISAELLLSSAVYAG